MLENNIVLTVLLILGWVIVALPFVFGAFVLTKIYLGRDKEAQEEQKKAKEEAKQAAKEAKIAAKEQPRKQHRRAETTLAPSRNRVQENRGDFMKRISETAPEDDRQAKQNILDDLLNDEFDHLPPKKSDNSGFPPPPPKLGL